MTPSSLGAWSPPGWRTFQLVLSCFVVSCLLSWATQLPERHLGESLDTLIQGALFNSTPRALQECNPLADEGKTPCIKQVAITQEDHETLFQRRSPLAPQPLVEFFDTLRQAAQAGKGPALVAVDLDLAPVDEADRVAREPLMESLVDLARHVPVVLVCPQNFHLGVATSLELAFVEELTTRAPLNLDRPSGLRFAGATLDGFGLYYDKVHAPLGAIAARWWRAPREPHNQTLRDDLQALSPCDAEALAREHERDSSVMIRPSPVERIAFGTTGEDLVGETMGRLVLLGGTYGTEDVFRLRGVDQPQYGVTLHHWILADELHPRSEPSNTFKNVVDIVVGSLAGVMLSFLWSAVHRYRHSFASHLGLYAVFLGVVTAVPVLLLYASVELAQFGITLSTAAMVISALFDAFQTTKSEDVTSQTPPVWCWQWLAGGLLVVICSMFGLWLFHVLDESVLLLSLTAILGLAFAGIQGYLFSTPGTAGVGQRSVRRAWGRSWLQHAREEGVVCAKDALDARARIDHWVYGVWQCTKVFVVVYASNEFGRRGADWNFWPLAHLLAFGVGCFAFDVLLQRIHRHGPAFVAAGRTSSPATGSS